MSLALRGVDNHHHTPAQNNKTNDLIEENGVKIHKSSLVDKINIKIVVFDDKLEENFDTEQEQTLLVVVNDSKIFKQSMFLVHPHDTFERAFLTFVTKNRIFFKGTDEEYIFYRQAIIDQYIPEGENTKNNE